MGFEGRGDDAEEWFGDWYEEPADLPFVVHLRRLCAAQLAVLVDPGATVHIQPGNEMNFGGSLLLVAALDQSTVRAISPDRFGTVQLQVLWNGETLQGYWGSELLWDAFDASDDDALNEQHPSMSDAAAAERTVRWLHEQLSRPLQLRHWERSDGRPAFEVWLTDTGDCVFSRGRSWRRRGTPTSVRQLRPPRSGPTPTR